MPRALKNVAGGMALRGACSQLVPLLPTCRVVQKVQKSDFVSLVSLVSPSIKLR